MDEYGCLIQVAIIIAIIYVIIMVIAYAVAAIAACGAIYGCYQAIVCYATALKRTYGRDPD